MLVHSMRVKKRPLIRDVFLWCRGRGLNSRRKDFQSFALPLSYLGLTRTLVRLAESVAGDNTRALGKEEGSLEASLVKRHAKGAREL